MLFSVISSFDTAYSAYNDFQHGIERYWTLRWLEQNAVAELEATVMKDGLVRAETLPLVFRVPGTESLPRGAKVRARISGTDLLTLDLHAQFAGRIEVQATVADEATAEVDDEVESSGPLTLAIDLSDAAEGAGTTAPDTADESKATAP